jgi:gliding motility-associated-like protein
LVNNPGTYVVSVSDDFGCIISEETFTVTFGVLVSPAVTVPLPPCEGEEVMVSASGSSGNYLWFSSATGGPSLGSGSSFVLPNVQSNTTIYLQAYSVGLDTCWSERVPVPIEVIAENVVLVDLDTLICKGASVMLPWGEIVQPAATDSFEFIWSSAVTGCDSLLMTVFVHLLDLQSISLPAQLTLHLGDSIRLEPVFNFQADSLIWVPPVGLSCTDCPDPWARPLQTIDYLLSIWSKEGCLITAPVQIIVKSDYSLFIPNVFSPNGDGTNDLFTVFAERGIGLISEFMIYDRWGELVWEMKDFPADGSVGWDGSFHGETMQSGVFAWICEVKLLDGSSQRLKGDLVLVR